MDPKVVLVMLAAAVVWYGGVEAVKGVKAIGRGTEKVVHAVLHRTIKHPLGTTPASEKKDGQ